MGLIIRPTPWPSADLPCAGCGKPSTVDILTDKYPSRQLRTVLRLCDDCGMVLGKQLLHGIVVNAVVRHMDTANEQPEPEDVIPMHDLGTNR